MQHASRFCLASLLAVLVVALAACQSDPQNSEDGSASSPVRLLGLADVRAGQNPTILDRGAPYAFTLAIVWSDGLAVRSTDLRAAGTAEARRGVEIGRIAPADLATLTTTARRLRERHDIRHRGWAMPPDSDYLRFEWRHAPDALPEEIGWVPCSTIRDSPSWTGNDQICEFERGLVRALALVDLAPVVGAREMVAARLDAGARPVEREWWRWIEGRPAASMAHEPTSLARAEPEPRPSRRTENRSVE